MPHQFNSIFNFLRDCPTLFHNICIILHWKVRFLKKKKKKSSKSPRCNRIPEVKKIIETALYDPSCFSQMNHSWCSEANNSMWRIQHGAQEFLSLTVPQNPPTRYPELEPLGTCSYIEHFQWSSGLGVCGESSHGL